MLTLNLDLPRSLVMSRRTMRRLSRRRISSSKLGNSRGTLLWLNPALRMLTLNLALSCGLITPCRTTRSLPHRHIGSSKLGQDLLLQLRDTDRSQEPLREFWVRNLLS